MTGQRVYTVMVSSHTEEELTGCAIRRGEAASIQPVWPVVLH